MAIGKVVKFDQDRGYGFIAPAGGGEDVFLHVNDLLMDEADLRPGLAVEFDVDQGGRGLKASNIRISAAAAASTSSTAETAAGHAPAFSTGHQLSPGALSGPDGLQHARSSAKAAAADSAENDGLCDVLRSAEFLAQITELLVTTVPSLTGEQVVAVRRNLLGFGRERGWIDA